MPDSDSIPRSICIIGAGFTGLAAAHELAGRGYSVTILERGDSPGGAAAGFTMPDWDWYAEYFYHHWFTNDSDIFRFMDALGLAHNRFVVATKTGIKRNGAVHPIDGPWSILQYPGVSITAKMRLAAAVLYLKTVTRWQRFDSVLLEDGLRSLFGTNATERIWAPLARSKWGGQYREVNMTWFWARIKKRTTRLGYYTGGFGRFARDAVAALEMKGVRVTCGTDVTGITKEGGKIAVTRDGGITERYDIVLLTSSPAAVERLCGHADAAFTQRLRSLRYLCASVFVFVLKESLLRGYYWLNVADDRAAEDVLWPLVVVEQTAIADRSHYGGSALVYVGLYRDVRSAEEWALFRRNALQVMREVNGRFDESWIVSEWKHHTEYAQPLYGLDHASTVPSFDTPIENLYWASMHHIYPWDRGTNYAVQSGRQVAAHILSRQSARED